MSLSDLHPVSLLEHPVCAEAWTKLAMLPAFTIPRPLQISLHPAELHVWQAKLDLPDEQFAALAMLLSADEQARAERMRIAAHRHTFIVARATLRCILSFYLNLVPAAIRLTYNRFGKPFVAAHDTPDVLDAACNLASVGGIEFSVAHSGNMTLYALARRRVGIDVEQVRGNVDILSIAGRFFATVEQQTLAALPAAHQLQAFFNCWTRKEAYTKACGMGLHLSFEQFAVSCRPGEAATLLEMAADLPLADTGLDAWRFWEVPLTDGYIGVVAVENASCEINEIKWWELVGASD